MKTLIHARIIVIIFYLIFNSIFAVHKVIGDSMAGHFNDGQYVFCLKRIFGQKFKLDDIIVFHSANASGDEILMIKKIIGSNGDLIRKIITRECEWFEVINENKKIVVGNLRDCSETDYGKVVRVLDYTINEDEYFVIGANLNNSVDSREFGPVNEQSISGRALFNF